MICGDFWDIKATPFISGVFTIISAFALGYWINVYLRKKNNIRDAGLSAIREIETTLKDIQDKMKSTKPELINSHTFLRFTSQIAVQVSKLWIILEAAKDRGNLTAGLNEKNIELKQSLTDISSENSFNPKLVQKRISSMQARLNDLWKFFL